MDSPADPRHGGAPLTWKDQKREEGYGTCKIYSGRDTGDPGERPGHQVQLGSVSLPELSGDFKLPGGPQAVPEEALLSRQMHPGARIGRGLFIDHGTGVIIGETTIIGNNVTLYQGVTLGGTGKEKGKRHPTLKDNVMVSAGAKILGSFTIGENSKIGAGAVVLKEVPPNCTVVGVPGRIVKMGDQKIPREDMDQVHLPDPVSNDIRELQQDNIRLKKELRELEKHMKCMKDNSIEMEEDKEEQHEAV